MRISASQTNTVQHQGRKTQMGSAQKDSWGEQMKSLREQQERIKQSKAELITKNEEAGGDADMIKEQLKNYNQQLQNLDSQIQTIMEKQIKEQKEKLGQGDKEKGSDNTPKTEEQLQSEKMGRLDALNTRLELSDRLKAIGNKTEQESRVSDADIKTDNRNRTDLIERIKLLNPGAEKGMLVVGATDGAYENLSELNDKVATLTQSLGESLDELQKDTADENVRVDEETDAAQTDKTGKPTDTAKSTDETEPENGMTKPTDKTEEADGTGQDAKSELEKAYDLTKEFTNQYEQWTKDAQGQKLDGKNLNDYVLDRVAQWTTQLAQRGDASLETWNRLITPLDVRA